MNYKNIYLSKYGFIIVPEDVLEIPPYKGSTFRGGFGSVFRKICCLDKRRSSCKQCLLKEKCPYSYIFETSPCPNSAFLKNLDDIPRPFIIEPPLDNRSVFTSEDAISFSLTLIGRAVDYLPYFVVAFKELGNVGIGKGKGRFRLEEIRAIRGNTGKRELIYSFQNQVIKNVDTRFCWADIMNSAFRGGRKSPVKQIIIEYLTPTRLKFQDELVSVPEFHIVIRSLLRRLANLAYFHCGENLDLDFNSLIGQATKIKTEEINLHWADWERYSFAQARRMKLGGFMGRVRYKGPLEPFLPFLKLGEYTHVGKGATFGLGWYRIKLEKNQNL